MNEPASTISPSASDPRLRSSWPYRLTFAGAAMVAAIVVVFFVIGVADGSVSSFNLGLWLSILVGIGAILLFGHRLNAHGHSKTAVALLLVLAVPGVLYALFIILVITSGARWN